MLLHFLAVQAIELARPALLGAVDEHAELATDIDQGPLFVVQLEFDAPDIARVLLDTGSLEHELEFNSAQRNSRAQSGTGMPEPCCAT